LREKKARGSYLAHLSSPLDFQMPDHPPLVSSAPREPAKRPRPVPAAVKAAIRLMVYGRDDGVPLNLLDAARAVQLKPWTLRRYFDRPAVISLLRAERRAFIATLIAGNPAALARIRDTAANTMSQVRAVDLLEAMGDETGHNRGIAAQSPHLTIVIRQPDHPAPAMRTIEHTPQSEPAPAPVFRRDAQGYRIDDKGRRVFDFDPI
jgi:hypothetical protein